VVLRFVEDLSIDQVAELTGRKPGTVRALTSQGLKRLREQLTKEAASEHG
jgi:DNA-directed RNA polymerase specialized sigma24 family protein